MRIERTAKTVIAGLMSVACLASVAACGPGSSSNKANTETEAVSTDLGDTKYELKLWDGAGLKTFDDQLIEAFQKKYPNITIKATYDPDNTSCIASMFVGRVRQCFSAVWADGFPRCRHRFPVM